MADVTSVRDTLNTSLETADTSWDTTMTTAGAAFGAAIDGIQDFDWQNVRDFVGTISNARKTAELGALSAQSSFLTSYYAGLNSYTSTLATASMGHSTAKAQATADYYINKADREADQAEADLAEAIANNADSSTINSLTATATAARNKSNAFIAYGASYVGHLTSVAQTAATTATASVATNNATTLATITADIATATGEINTFYTQQITDAANPPPVDDDANDDGVPDPPKPTMTQQMADQLAALQATRGAERQTIHEAFSGDISRRNLQATDTLPQAEVSSTGTTTATQTTSPSGGTIAYSTPPTGSTGSGPVAAPPAVTTQARETIKIGGATGVVVHSADADLQVEQLPPVVTQVVIDGVLLQKTTYHYALVRYRFWGSQTVSTRVSHSEYHQLVNVEKNKPPVLGPRVDPSNPRKIEILDDLQLYEDKRDVARSIGSVAGKLYNGATRAIVIAVVASAFLPGPEDVVIEGIAVTKLGIKAASLAKQGIGFAVNKTSGAIRWFLKNGDEIGAEITEQSVKNIVGEGSEQFIKETVDDAAKFVEDAAVVGLKNVPPLRTGKWGPGSLGSASRSLTEHFTKHGSEVGAKDIDQYLRKAEAFAQNLRGATKSAVDGATPGVTRYKKLGKYIDLDRDGNIISFGSQ